MYQWESLEYLEEYKKSYGRTYVQDKKNIYRLADARLAIIRRYLKGGTLLDIGAAHRLDCRPRFVTGIFPIRRSFSTAC